MTLDGQSRPKSRSEHLHAPTSRRALQELANAAGLHSPRRAGLTIDLRGVKRTVQLAPRRDFAKIKLVIDLT